MRNNTTQQTKEVVKQTKEVIKNNNQKVYISNATDNNMITTKTYTPNKYHSNIIVISKNINGNNFLDINIKLDNGIKMLRWYGEGEIKLSLKHRELLYNNKFKISQLKNMGFIEND